MLSVLCTIPCALITVYACTIGVFSPATTEDGRPILWKNRDVESPNRETKILSGPKFRFVANVYAGETLDVWAGINEAGFAIMNSNSYNPSGLPTPHLIRGDDGNIMRLALGNCATVNDFARLLDSFNIVGRETPANYGVFDATGAAAIFEASNTYYTRYDADLDSLGFLLRANYSISGAPTRLVGKNRFERAMELCLERRALSVYWLSSLSELYAVTWGRLALTPTLCPFQTSLSPYLMGTCLPIAQFAAPQPAQWR